MADTPTVLVVDNETDQLEIMALFLDRLGYATTTTDDPQKALKMVAKQPFDLVFIDLIMSDTDGTELCEQIKRLRPATRLFAFTGHARLYPAERLSRAGFDGIIEKPATMDDIRRILERALRATAPNNRQSKES